MRPIQRFTLHEEVVKRIRAEILSKLRPGDKLETEASLTKRFGVSRGTVREAMTTFVHEGLIERRAGGGTVVLNLAARRQARVGVWFTLNPRAEYALRVLSHMLVSLAERGLAVKPYLASERTCHSPSDPACRELLDDLAQHRIDALGIVTGPVPGEVGERIAKTRMTVVGCTPDDFIEGASYLAAEIVNPCSAMVQEGTRWLLEQGCRRIAWLAWLSRGELSDRLMELFRQTLAEHGAAFREEWVRADLDPNLPGAGYEEFREVWAGRIEKPDGLLVTDDVLLPDVALAVREQRIRVPEQLRVVAHANRGMMTCPSFPARRMELDPRETAGAMSERLAQAVRGDPIEPRRTTLTFRWVEPGTAEAIGRPVENAICK